MVNTRTIKRGLLSTIIQISIALPSLLITNHLSYTARYCSQIKPTSLHGTSTTCSRVTEKLGLGTRFLFFQGETGPQNAYPLEKKWPAPLHTSNIHDIRNPKIRTRSIARRNCSLLPHSSSFTCYKCNTYIARNDSITIQSSLNYHLHPPTTNLKETMTSKLIRPYDFIEATTSEIYNVTTAGANTEVRYLSTNSIIHLSSLRPLLKMHGRMGLLINNKCTNAETVLVPFKAPHNGTPPPPHPTQFDMHTWINTPHSPERLFWTRVTRETENCIIHYMAGSTRINAFAVTPNRTEYIGDVLFLKIIAGEVVDIDEDDIQEVLTHLNDLF